MERYFHRIYLVVLYIIGVLLTTYGGLGIIEFSLIVIGILAFIAIVGSLTENDQSKLDKMFWKIRSLFQVAIAILITALLFKLF
ncbi:MULTISPECIES: hypothetical protein [Paenibacillus]|jgi:uncharacterized RDD family membrane protein YckC|uniref:DUF5316 domain-containing protein n=1 Tax=Paenibacillus vandeheii TaxID=3035917 RepID=A0ABT8JED7_9BACL|nr:MULTISPECIES: hypothetical protein [Paenibacillus]KGP78198.1 hypothetical protein P364_0129475 [Paenibacillus sp. MAEPY2]KGP84819.1 hypothetical protein P363_0122720 [Paenibacillus sp. MAEPY1]MDN4603405.1 hypothetical protein [Paenibacillus vandeheii]OZQ72889.1 hypothetical protein CA599_05350 [Paenibacillus taichungensis]HBU81874.1 hypothetical protein [Paenibacillus sp.]